MRVLVIGGTGKVGSGIARCLLDKKCISSILITDGNSRDIAEKTAQDLGEKVKGFHLNVEDAQNLHNLISKTDMVLNMVGPASKYAAPILKASLEAGKNYLDVNDDAESLSSLFDLHTAAKDKGLTMLICTGASPGMTNLLARYGADKLDEVDEINIFWACNINLAEDTPGNWGHRLNMYAERVPMFEDGRIQYVAGGTGGEEIEWPNPVGKLVHRYCGHAEPITIPRYIKKGLKRVTCKGAVTPGEVNEFLIQLGRIGLPSTGPIHVGDVAVSPFDFASHFISSEAFHATRVFKDLLARERQIGPNFEVRVEVKGWKDMRPHRVILTQVGPERNSATYIPAAALTEMVLTEKINMRGVICPEALGLDPKPITDEVAKAGANFREEIDEYDPPADKEGLSK